MIPRARRRAPRRRRPSTDRSGALVLDLPRVVEHVPGAAPHPVAVALPRRAARRAARRGPARCRPARRASAARRPCARRRAAPPARARRRRRGRARRPRGPLRSTSGAPATTRSSTRHDASSSARSPAVAGPCSARATARRARRRWWSSCRAAARRRAAPGRQRQPGPRRRPRTGRGRPAAPRRRPAPSAPRHQPGQSSALAKALRVASTTTSTRTARRRVPLGSSPRGVDGGAEPEVRGRAQLALVDVEDVANGPATCSAAVSTWRTGHVVLVGRQDHREVRHEHHGEHVSTSR